MLKLKQGTGKWWLSGVALALVMQSAYAIQSVNINKASAKDIADALDNIGMAKAEAIVKYRAEHGPFTTVDQVANVQGIGPKTLEKNKGYILLKDASQPRPRAANEGAAAPRAKPKTE